MGTKSRSSLDYYCFQLSGYLCLEIGRYEAGTPFLPLSFLYQTNFQLSMTRLSSSLSRASNGQAFGLLNWTQLHEHATLFKQALVMRTNFPRHLKRNLKRHGGDKLSRRSLWPND